MRFAKMLVAVLMVTGVAAANSAPAPSLPDYTKAPYRLVTTDGPGRGGSCLLDYWNETGSIDVYADPHRRASDGEEVVSNVIGIFKDKDGKTFYAEWQDWSGKVDMVRGYRPVRGEWQFDRELPHSECK